MVSIFYPCNGMFCTVDLFNWIDCKDECIGLCNFYILFQMIMTSDVCNFNVNKLRTIDQTSAVIISKMLAHYF